MRQEAKIHTLLIIQKDRAYLLEFWLSGRHLVELRWGVKKWCLLNGGDLRCEARLENAPRSFE